MRKLKGCKLNNYRIDDNYGYIELINKFGEIVGEAKIDKQFLQKTIKAGRWFLRKRNDCTTNHVIGTLYNEGKINYSFLHNFLIGNYKDLCVDHINGDGLDNTLENLCIVTHQQNSEKRLGADRDSYSGIRGIRWEENRKKFLVRYKKNGKTINIGRFTNLEDAIIVNNKTREQIFPYNAGKIPLLNLMSILNNTTVNGPGNRMAIWTQGCSKGCKGCFNPESWNNKIKHQWTPQALAQYVISSNPEGITYSGGDPLEQPEALLEFLKALHLDKSPEELCANFLPRGIICFTGFRIEELVGAAKECLDYIDLLIDGRYVESLRYTSGLAGSSNQRFHFSKTIGRGESRIKRSEVLFDQAIEVHVDDVDPTIIRVTGFPTINRKFLKDFGLVIEDKVE